MLSLANFRCSAASANSSRRLLLCGFLTLLVTCPAFGDLLGGSVELSEIPIEVISEPVEGKPFALDSLPTEVRTAARGSLDTFADSIRKKEKPAVDPDASWELEFTTDLKRNVENPKKQVRDELGLLPSPTAFADEGNALSANASDRIRVAARSSYDEVLSEGLFDLVVNTGDREAKSVKTLPVRPEPSGMAMVLMCLVSLIVVGSCTRLLRPLRQEPREIS